MMRRIVQAAIVILLPGIFFFGVICFVGADVSAQKQKRRPSVKRRTRTRPPLIDYSRFSHATRKHQGACNTCHKVPTDNWKKVRDFPDVADYPGHDACVGCHRPQFFKGAKPVICSICHSKVSPRDDVRFAFRNPAAPRQFLIEFPHDKHQDVIARLRRPRPVTQTVSLRAGAQSSSIAAETTQANSLRSWAHSTFVATPTSETNSSRYNILSPRSAVVESKHYNNCEICHGPRTAAPPAPASGWPDAFVPDAATFKAAPTSHASCFNCHWKSQQPTNENCAGCHKLSDKPSQLYSAADVPKRFSLKFRHAREQHVQECTTCHINITKATTLRGLQPDVPITSCSECHNKDGLRLDVNKELEAIDKNRDFVCGYCHTSDIGRRDPPGSHYLIAGREPIRRKDIK
jgi:LSD1 subclass zinc finger protein